MSRIRDAAVYATTSTIVAAIVITVVRNLLGDPIYATDLLIIAAIIWLGNFAIKLILTRSPKPAS